MKIEQSINTTVFDTTKRGCRIEASGGQQMFKLLIGGFKRDNGSTQRESEHYLYQEELDTLIEALIAFKEQQLTAKIIRGGMKAEKNISGQPAK